MTEKKIETPMYLVPGRLTDEQDTVIRRNMIGGPILDPADMFALLVRTIGTPIQPCADVETVSFMPSPPVPVRIVQPTIGTSETVMMSISAIPLVRRADMDVQVAVRDEEIARLRVVEAEMHLLEEVCAFYANDEDRFIKADGNAEPYGMIPTDVGMKARSARARFMAREQAAQEAGGASMSYNHASRLADMTVEVP